MIAIVACDPLLRVIACTGAPGCTQAQIETRSLARELAPFSPGGVTWHVSGCTKGCAHPMPAKLTFTGTKDGLSVIENGRASDTPVAMGLTLEELKEGL